MERAADFRADAYRAPVGVGVGLRRAHFGAWAQCARQVDWLELIPEVFVGVGGEAARVLHSLRERYALVPHGVSLSLGGPDAMPEEKLDGLRELCASLRAPYYSDHICLASIDGVETFDLIPLPFCEEAADHVAHRARTARARIERPLVLENITYYAAMPGSEWDEGRFLHGVFERCDAGLLLDVSNVVVNAKNQGRDARELLEALPLARTEQIHLAGHRHQPEWGVVIDDHASAPSDESLALYEHALRCIGRPVPTLIEWDQDLPTLDALLDQADRARAVLHRVFDAPSASAQARR